MEYFPVKVQCHSGYKADEYPKKFIWDHVEFGIIEVIDRWYEGYRTSGHGTVHYYRVRTELRGSFLLKHEVENNQWFLVV